MTYAEMIFSRGSGGKPTVSCFWCDSRSVQAYLFRRKDEGEREKKRGKEGGRQRGGTGGHRKRGTEEERLAKPKGKGTANKITNLPL